MRRPFLRATLIIAAGAIVGFAIAIANGSVGRRESSPPVRGAASVSAVTEDGRLRCGARLPSAVLVPGMPTGIMITLTNLTDRRVRTPAWSDLVVTDGAGAQLWGAQASFPGVDVPIPMVAIAPHGSVAVRTSDVVVRWPGTLSLRADCLDVPGLPTVPAISARVLGTGTAPPVDVALDAALSVTGGLFRSCLPIASGSWVVGTIDPPVATGTPAQDAPTRIPPMNARCSARIVREPGFDVVTLLYVVPADAPGAAVQRYLKMTDAPNLAGDGSVEEGRWVFVITSTNVTEAEPLESLYRTMPSDNRSVAYAFEGGAWHIHSAARCGAAGLATIEFITPCGR